ncbi:hypothetical protein DPMN_135817 [Dreissena polymorpha]|uniref:Uncharacterized protein n=1 Tax=Dreissena polymorpha TaxID=45954 RepID=A0A9D4FZS0_DREPO|nr:hypothetical protein DPMN_135817 [Dreissena polymorpha]
MGSFLPDTRMSPFTRIGFSPANLLFYITGLPVLRPSISCIKWALCTSRNIALVAFCVSTGTRFPRFNSTESKDLCRLQNTVNLCSQANALSNLFQSEKWLIKSSIFFAMYDAVVLITTSCLTSESSSATSGSFGKQGQIDASCSMYCGVGS